MHRQAKVSGRAGVMVVDAVGGSGELRVKADFKPELVGPVPESLRESTNHKHVLYTVSPSVAYMDILGWEC